MAVTTTGSRNGIIAWAVTASIIGVGSLIWAAISFTQASKAQDDLKTITNQYRAIASPAEIGGDDVTQLTNAKNDAERGLGGYNLLALSRQQTLQLAQFLGGSSATDDAAVRRQVQAVLDKAKQDAAAKPESGAAIEGAVDTSSVFAALRTLNDNAAKLRSAITERDAALEAARAETAAALAQNQKLVADRSDTIEATLARSQAAEANANTYATSQDEQVAAANRMAADKAEEGIRRADELNVQLTQTRQQLAQQRRDYEELKGRLESFRVPVDQILTRADGVITRVDGIDRVFINLGRGDGIAPGMTFEVYDRLGVPRVASDNPSEDANLKGKASIEVLSIQPGIAACRITRLSPGAAITEGDPIANLVYDRNVKFNFYVYGNFNLDYKGVPTERDTEIVRRLISGWGGQVADELNSRTDFVILGDEPVVPNYTQDELAREPEKAFEKERAEQALEAYTETRAKANALNIPVLNQTRFLYMVGYYNEAAR